MSFDPGYMSKLDERREWHPAPVEGTLTPGAASRPELFGLVGERPSAALVDEIEAGTLKALIVAGGSLFTALPEPDRLRAALQSLEVLAVVDIVHNPLTDIATHVLPAVGQLERPGITAWNGRAVFTPAILPANPGRLAPWRVYGRIAEAFGANILNGYAANIADELEVLASLTAGARFDLPTLREAGPSGLPVPTLYGWVQRALPDGRWRIASPVLIERLQALVREGNHSRDDLQLVSRRQVQHYSATHYVDENRRHDRPLLLISPADAGARNIVSGDRVRIATAAGSLVVTADVTARIREGVVSLPHGWLETNVAHLISGKDGIDPLTGQPPMSGISVTVRPSKR
jgi:anaerobic selenocysteine-containing dehydrogenase